MKKVYIIIALMALICGILCTINKNYLGAINMLLIMVVELSVYNILGKNYK